MVNDRQMFQDSKQVIVPPIKNFLEVRVESDNDRYQPQEEGTLTVTTRDHEGNPVSAEVALGLVDESVYAIQQDLASDPRQFFFGQKRTQRPQTKSTFQFKSYLKLVEGEKGNLLDENELKNTQNNAPARFDYKEEDGVRREFAQKMRKPSSPFQAGRGCSPSDRMAPESLRRLLQQGWSLRKA